ncbi:hypothetical protein [Streptomyces sp. NPDC005167]
MADSFALVVGLARLSGRGKRPTDVALFLFGEGLPVPEPTVRAAFHTAVDTVRLPGGAESGQDVEGQLDAVDSYIGRGGQAAVMVPTRARRVVEADDRLPSPPASPGLPQSSPRGTRTPPLSA